MAENPYEARGFKKVESASTPTIDAANPYEEVGHLKVSDTTDTTFDQPNPYLAAGFKPAPPLTATNKPKFTTSESGAVLLTPEGFEENEKEKPGFWESLKNAIPTVIGETANLAIPVNKENPKTGKWEEVPSLVTRAGGIMPAFANLAEGGLINVGDVIDATKGLESIKRRGLNTALSYGKLALGDKDALKNADKENTETRYNLYKDMAERDFNRGEKGNSRVADYYKFWADAYRKVGVDSVADHLEEAAQYADSAIDEEGAQAASIFAADPTMLATPGGKIVARTIGAGAKRVLPKAATEAVKDLSGAVAESTAGKALGGVGGVIARPAQGLVNLAAPILENSGKAVSKLGSLGDIALTTGAGTLIGGGVAAANGSGLGGIIAAGATGGALGEGARRLGKVGKGLENAGQVARGFSNAALLKMSPEALRLAARESTNPTVQRILLRAAGDTVDPLIGGTRAQALKAGLGNMSEKAQAGAGKAIQKVSGVVDDIHQVALANAALNSLAAGGDMSAAGQGYGSGIVYGGMGVATGPAFERAAQVKYNTLNESLDDLAMSKAFSEMRDILPADVSNESVLAAIRDQDISKARSQIESDLDTASKGGPQTPEVKALKNRVGFEITDTPKRSAQKAAFVKAYTDSLTPEQKKIFEANQPDLNTAFTIAEQNSTQKGFKGTDGKVSANNFFLDSDSLKKFGFDVAGFQGTSSELLAMVRNAKERGAASPVLDELESSLVAQGAKTKQNTGEIPAQPTFQPGADSAIEAQNLKQALTKAEAVNPVVESATETTDQKQASRAGLLTEQEAIKERLDALARQPATPESAAQAQQLRDELAQMQALAPMVEKVNQTADDEAAYRAGLMTPSEVQQAKVDQVRESVKKRGLADIEAPLGIPGEKLPNPANGLAPRPEAVTVNQLGSHVADETADQTPNAVSNVNNASFQSGHNVFHEGWHNTEDVIGEGGDETIAQNNANLRNALIGVRDDQGRMVTPGNYTEAELDALVKQYVDRLQSGNPSFNPRFDHNLTADQILKSQGPAALWARNDLLASELRSEHGAVFGKGADDGLVNAANAVDQGKINYFRKALEALGVNFTGNRPFGSDQSAVFGLSSGLQGLKQSPEVTKAIAHVVLAQNRINQRLVSDSEGRGNTREIKWDEVKQNPAIADQAIASGVVKTRKKSGPEIQAEAEALAKLVSTNPTPEQVEAMKAKVAPDTIAYTPTGKVYMNTPADMKRSQVQIATALIDILQKAPEDNSEGAMQPIRDKDTNEVIGYQGRYFSDAQLQALLDAPNRILPQRIKDTLEFANKYANPNKVDPVTGQKLEGTPLEWIYYAALDEKGKYSSGIQQSFRIGSITSTRITKKGNFTTNIFDATGFEKAFEKEFKKNPEKFSAWGAAKDDATMPEVKQAFMKDVATYLENHEAGQKGKTGLDPIPDTAEAKADAINEFFNIKDKASENNKSGLFPKNQFRKTFRLDRVGNVQEATGPRFAIRADLQKRKFQPSSDQVNSDAFKNWFGDSKVSR